MKKSLLKKKSFIFLIISFLPVVCIIFISFVNIFRGFGVELSTYYGFEAFVATMYVYLFLLWGGWPVLPVCTIYQCFYFIIYISGHKFKTQKRRYIANVFGILSILIIAISATTFFEAVINIISI